MQVSGSGSDKASIDDPIGAEGRRAPRDNKGGAVSPPVPTFNRFIAYLCDDPAVDWAYLRFEGRCYFYPQRDCPGWEGGIVCGRIGRRIPDNAEEE